MTIQTTAKRIFRFGQPFINPAKDLIDEESIRIAARPFREEKPAAPGPVAICVFANGAYLIGFVMLHPLGSWWPGPLAMVVFPLMGVGLPLLFAWMIRPNIWRAIVRAAWSQTEGELWEWLFDFGYEPDRADPDHVSRMSKSEQAADLADWLADSLPTRSVGIRKRFVREVEKLRLNYPLCPKGGLSTGMGMKEEVDEILRRVNREFLSKRQFDLSVALWALVLVNLSLMVILW